MSGKHTGAAAAGKHKRRRIQALKLRHSLLVASIILFFATVAYRALAQPSPHPQPATAGSNFSDPVTLSQVRALFDALGFADASLPRLHQGLEAERKKLPPWYPPAIWDEIEHAIEDTDRAQIALPVYQKYLSRGEAQLLLKFYTSPAGRALTRKLLASAAASRASGSSSEQARIEAASTISRSELKSADQAWSKVSSEEKRQAEFFVDSGDYKHFVQSVGPMSAEYATLFRARQQQIIDSISEAHGGDLTQARDAYKAVHPDLPAAPALQAPSPPPTPPAPQP